MKRILRLFAWLFAGLVLLYVLFVVTENYSGARALAAAKEKLAQEGGSLDLQKILSSSAVPEKGNFCALEPLSGVTLQNEAADAKRLALKELDWHSPSHKERVKLLLKPSPSVGSGYITATPFDWKAACAYLRDRGYLDTEENASASEVLQSLDHKFALLAQFADAALTHMDAAWTPPVGTGHDGPACHMPMPHMNTAYSISKGLAFRTHTALAAGNAEDAVRSIQAMIRLTQAGLNEPTLISLLIAITTEQFVHDSIWALLRSRLTDASQIQRLQDEIRRIDFMKSALHSMRGELAFQASTIDYFRPTNRRWQAAGVIARNGLPPELAQESSWLKEGLLYLVPSGFFDHNMATIVQVNQEQLIQPLEKGNVAELLEQFRRSESMLAAQNEWQALRYVFVRLSRWSQRTVLRQAIYEETMRLLVLAALEIESERLKSGRLPESPSLPTDPVTQKAVHYRLDADGAGYALWADGFDGEDDNAAMPTKKDSVESEKFTGDWVWRIGP
ncbi:MAG: hypothetical protein IPK32_23400 [Verrucomicrobiaceae bacterium]|nr:hypothetical protein [Verrucomicrobiaceae bacterium]